MWLNPYIYGIIEIVTWCFSNNNILLVVVVIKDLFARKQVSLLGEISRSLILCVDYFVRLESQDRGSALHSCFFFHRVAISVSGFSPATAAANIFTAASSDRDWNEVSWTLRIGIRFPVTLQTGMRFPVTLESGKRLLVTLEPGKRLPVTLETKIGFFTMQTS